MAKIEIESAFIEPWTRNEPQHPAWGMKTSEPHRRKGDDGKYETVARTYRTVKVSRDSGIDLSVFVAGDRVQVWGREVTEKRTYEVNGEPKTAYELIVWADRIERAETVVSRREEAPADPGESDAWQTAAIPVDDAGVPF